MTVWKTFTTRRGGLRRWLTASGSLSARLAATGQGFSVQVLRQGRHPLMQGEAAALGAGSRRSGYAREVVLRVDGTPLVFARSVTVHAHAVGAWRSLRGLGNRPLADVLFQRTGIKRAPLAFAQPARHSPLQRHVEKSWQAATGSVLPLAALPARHSVFTRHGAALLVMELFVAQKDPWAWPNHLATRCAKPHQLP